MTPAATSTNNTGVGLIRRFQHPFFRAFAAACAFLAFAIVTHECLVEAALATSATACCASDSPALPEETSSHADCSWCGAPAKLAGLTAALLSAPAVVETGRLAVRGSDWPETPPADIEHPPQLS